MSKYRYLFMALLFIGVFVLFVYGYVKVYTNSYNDTHREKIVGWDLHYDDKTIHITICGKNFDIVI